MKKALYLILAGVAIGILIAQDKGSEIWKKLKGGLEDLKDQALSQVNDVVAKVKDSVGKGANLVSESAEATRKATSEW